MNVSRPTAWLLSSLLALASAACTCKKDAPAPEEPKIQTTKVSYAQTQCSDKWGQARTPQQLEALATAYLAQQGIILTNPKATQSAPAAVCNACMCPTGVVLVGEVPPGQLAAVQALGFQKI